VLDRGEHDAKLSQVRRDFVQPPATAATTAISSRQALIKSVQAAPLEAGKDPVSRALMSGLYRDMCRWPSWVFACVSGTNLL
jgi:hypothetical protein